MPADAIDGDDLRRAAAATATDPRLRAALATAVVTVTPDGPPWAASQGPVQGHAVDVALCAEDLAAVDASPSLRDLLVRAFANAVASSRGRSLTSAATRWNRRVRAHATAYRDAAVESVEADLGEGLGRYLDASGAPHPSDVSETAKDLVEAHGDSLDRRARARVEAALRSMLGPGVSVRWV